MPRNNTFRFEPVAAWWRGFRENAIPKGAPQRQHEEMRKAFISGYWTALSVLQTVPDFDDEEYMALELERHYQEVTDLLYAISPKK